MAKSRAMLLVVLLATSLGFGHEAAACRCPGPEGVEAAMVTSDVVFSGFVVSKSVETGWRAHPDRMDVSGRGAWEAEAIEPTSFSRRYGIGFVRPLGYTAHIKVFHVWKGEVGEEADVLSQIDGAYCGYQFKVGNSYLVYARQSDTGRWSVDLCGRTSELRDAMDDAKALGAPITDHVRARAEALLANTPRRLPGEQP